MYRVIIVEDDPMVIEINRQYVEYNGKLNVVGVFSNGQTALDYLKSNPVDLIILDYHMPVMDGISFLRALRGAGGLQEIIMVTAVNDAQNIGRLYNMGVLDYLIKPFDHARFQTALNRFIQRREALEANEVMSQSTIDRFFAEMPAAPESRSYIDKGIQPATLELICNYLRQHRNEKLSIDMLAEGLSLSRVTLRRYMNYLMNKNSVISGVDYHTGGRPSAIYTYIGK